MILSRYATACMIALTTSGSWAQIAPDATGFGALPAAGFGGSGIPNTEVAQTTVKGVTLGLSAAQRYSNAVVTSDGAGTFFAQAGIDTLSPASASDPLARWNFNHAILGANANQYNYRLFYDFNPAAGASRTSAGIGVANIYGSQLTTITPAQNSNNLGFNLLTANIPLYNAAPGPSFVFDPNALGEYSFELVAYNRTGSALFGFLGYGAEVIGLSTSMLVSSIPEPGEWAMMMSGLAVVGLMARRRRIKSGH
jgi:hypothetical protein